LRKGNARREGREEEGKTDLEQVLHGPCHLVWQEPEFGGYDGASESQAAEECCERLKGDLALSSRRFCSGWRFVADELIHLPGKPAGVFSTASRQLLTSFPQGLTGWGRAT